MYKIVDVMIAAIAVGVVGFGVAPVARASQCGYLGTDNGNNKIILGEQTNYFMYQGQKVYYGTGNLATCYRGSDSYTHYAVLGGCDVSSTTSDFVYVQAFAGNDNLAPAVTDGSCYLDYMWPWDDGVFDFYIDAEMGDGADRANGSGHGDILYSNEGPYDYGDGDEDFLCGYGGNDTLYGDGDHTDATEETMVGGTGTDYCYGKDGESYYDWANCEYRYDAYNYTDDAPCETSAPNLWPI